MPPLIVNKGRIFDSDTDLLKVLAPDSAKLAMPPKKRKLEPPPTKNIFADPPRRPGRKREDCKRGRSAARRLHKAVQHDLVPPKLFACKRLPQPKTRVVDRVVVHSGKRKAKASVECGVNDSRVVRNVIVKNEVVDLTHDDEVLVVCLRFARECRFETAQVFEAPTAQARLVEELALPVAVVHVPQVCFHVEDTCIDLTDEEEVVASEKELANRILSVVFDCHRVHEMRDLVPDKASSDGLAAANWASQQASFLGRVLLDVVDSVFVKNLNLLRFLEIVASKLGALYGVAVKPQVVASYLLGMLEPQRGACTSRLARELLRSLDEYGAMLQVKQEAVGAPVMFTGGQMEQLKDQIEAYLVIVTRQQELMAVYDGFSDMDREVKMEILNTRPELGANFDVDGVVCIDD